MNRVPFPEIEPDVERALTSLVVRERFARDTGDWGLLEDCYWPDSIVQVTWFRGTAAEFVEVSRLRARTGSGFHTLEPVRIDVDRDRAIIESRGGILLRPRFGGVECDVTSWCRFFSRVERRDGVWRLRTFDGIYIKDRVDPVDAAVAVSLDQAILDAARPSYRHLAYLNLQAGHGVPGDLPGVDRPDLVQAFYAAAESWLHGTSH